MNWKPIEKPKSHWRVTPNLLDYEETQRAFSWSLLEEELCGSSHQGLNIADIAIDRHTKGNRAHQTALRFIDKERM
jgi:acetyl-CoA synthetase